MRHSIFALAAGARHGSFSLAARIQLGLKISVYTYTIGYIVYTVHTLRYRALYLHSDQRRAGPQSRE